MMQPAMAAMKAAMALIGLDCGPNRLPLETLTVAEIDALRDDLESIGFFDWALGSRDTEIADGTE